MVWYAYLVPFSPARAAGESRPLITATALTALALGALVPMRPHLDAATWVRGDDLALAVAWIIAVAASAWLFVATGACVLALRLGRPRVARRLAPTLPAGIRRLVEVAIVASCVALPALPALPASAAPATPVVADQPVVRAPAPAPVTISTPATNPTPAATTAPAFTPEAAPTPKPATPAPVSAPRQDHVVVRAGDNLWLIARAAVTRMAGANPTDAEVAHYWRAVIAANRSTLRSGNPSLIFPGEIVALPAVSVLP